MIHTTYSFGLNQSENRILYLSCCPVDGVSLEVKDDEGIKIIYFSYLDKEDLKNLQRALSKVVNDLEYQEKNSEEIS